MPKTRQTLAPEELASLTLAWEAWEKGVSTPARRIVRARLHLVFLFVRYGGLRLKEVLGMHARALLDLESGLLSVPGDNAREIMLPLGCMHHFRRILSLPEAENAGFLSLDEGFVRRKFYLVAETCSLEPSRAAPRALRYARALELLSLRVPLSMVQKYLGQPGPAAAFFLNFAGGELADYILSKARAGRDAKDNIFVGIATGAKMGLRRAEIEIACFGNTLIRAQASLDRLQDLDLGSHRQVVTFRIPPNAMALALSPCQTSQANTLEATLTGLHADAVEGFATAHLACGVTLTVALEWGNICPSDLYEGRRVWLHFAAASVEIEG